MVTIDFDWEIDLSQLPTSERRKVEQQLATQFEKATADLKDPETGQPPKFSVKVLRANKLDLDIECSETHLAEIETRLQKK